MKAWSNAYHIKVLQENKKRRADRKIKPTPHYDTSYIDPIQKNKNATQIISGNERF